ncbi:hypothetical protein CALVIDRAFT_275462 [Calocera viscosa TUFC12733]|uniref:Uncharacterized protein n=1 Tax=Calocera viscosa (strain TUFC12733) TaxID=1330018 RepID=A0A167QZU4_CALVF|nr:hypothetical protein CALVIDRAFT_275462 [Calocera viscosa TUFC12733]
MIRSALFSPRAVLFQAKGSMLFNMSDVASTSLFGHQAHPSDTHPRARMRLCSRRLTSFHYAAGCLSDPAVPGATAPTNLSHSFECSYFFFLLFICAAHNS